MNQIVLIAINGISSKKQHSTNYADMSDSQITQKFNKMLSCIRDGKCNLKVQKKLEEFQMVVRRICIVRNTRANNNTGTDIYNQIYITLRNSGLYKFELTWVNVNKPKKNTKAKVVDQNHNGIASTLTMV
jgi:hypothetical protein